MTSRWAQSRADHKTQQAADIARAAFGLLIREGTAGLSMAAIADAAGVARQTLYRYYPDLDAVLVGIARLVAESEHDLADAVLASDDPDVQLETFIRTVFSTAPGHPSPAAIEALLPPEARELVADHEHRLIQLVAGILRRGVDAGAFRPDIDPTLDAHLLQRLIIAATPLLAMYPDRLVERVVTIARRIVT
jgi:AcrR family transcriptional regulator